MVVFACLGVLTLAAAAAAGNGGLLPPAPHSPNAQRISNAYVFVLVFTGIVFVLVEGVLIAFVIRYRRGKRARTLEGPQIHGSTKLETLWTVVPVVMLAAIGTFVFYELPAIADAPAASAADQTKVVVQGRQFYWQFTYPNGAVSIGRMVAPAGKVVHEDVTSPDNDVNHSWWVPALGGKLDAIPGRVNKTWFRAPAGSYVARCAELCGVQHARMTAVVEVVPPAEYDQFVAEREGNLSVALGKEEFEGVCLNCHRLDTAYVGPALGGNPLLTDREGIETILRQGVGNMPAVGSGWSDAQIDSLVMYTKTLKQGAGGNQG